ncbi:anti-repressor SinI family protein [Rossellomorea marisflavi]
MESKAPIEEWYELIQEARETGVSIEEIREFIQNLKNNNK